MNPSAWSSTQRATRVRSARPTSSSVRTSSRSAVPNQARSSFNAPAASIFLEEIVPSYQRLLRKALPASIVPSLASRRLMFPRVNIFLKRSKIWVPWPRGMSRRAESRSIGSRVRRKRGWRMEKATNASSTAIPLEDLPVFVDTWCVMDICEGRYLQELLWHLIAICELCLSILTTRNTTCTLIENLFIGWKDEWLLNFQLRPYAAIFSTHTYKQRSTAYYISRFHLNHGYRRRLTIISYNIVQPAYLTFI